VTRALDVPGQAGALEHEVIFYRGLDDFVDGVVRFVRDGLAAEEPVLVSVPRQRHDPLRAGLGAYAPHVTFLDMTEVGRNPGRIIPAIRKFCEAQGPGRIRFVGEPIWPGRNAAEIRECTRHEALLNLAFREIPVTILCPYDESGLDAATLSDARRTHPVLVNGVERRDSADYTDPLTIYESADSPLPAAPADATTLEFGPGSLPEVRTFMRQRLRDAALTGDRADDLLLAVNEVVTNSLIYGGAFGTLRTWSENGAGSIICEVSDQGCIADPLVGRHSPRPGAEGGRGLWLVHQFCDLAEVRSDASGTIIRMYAAG
jgi:anti-sigma regulatory factor (Ser/Thr protein kinase)